MKKNNGFSLLELMITLGLMSAASIGYMKLMSQQTKQNKTNVANQEAANLHSEIKSYLGKSGVCDKTFENLTLEDNLQLKEIKKTNGKAKFKIDQIYGNRAIKIKAIQFLDFEEEEGNPLKGSGQLAFTFEKMGKVYGGKRVVRKIELDLILDKSDKIISCAPLGLLNLSGLGLSNSNTSTEKKELDSKETSEKEEIVQKVEIKKEVVKIPKVPPQPTESIKVAESKETEPASLTSNNVASIIQKMASDPSSVNPKDAKKVQGIINANPQLKEMYNMIKQMQQSQKQHQKYLEE